MRKRLLLIYSLIIVFGISSYGQEYKRIYEIEGASVNSLYKSTKSWVYSNITNADKNTKFLSNDNVIISNLESEWIEFPMLGDKLRYKISGVLKVEFKEERYKVSILNIQLVGKLGGSKIYYSTLKECSTINGFNKFLIKNDLTNKFNADEIKKYSNDYFNSLEIINKYMEEISSSINSSLVENLSW